MAALPEVAAGPFAPQAQSIIELLQRTPVMDVKLPKTKVISVTHDASPIESFRVRHLTAAHSEPACS